MSVRTWLRWLPLLGWIALLAAVALSCDAMAVVVR